VQRSMGPPRRRGGGSGSQPCGCRSLTFNAGGAGVLDGAFTGRRVFRPASTASKDTPRPFFVKGRPCGYHLLIRLVLLGWCS
jgi:hypothetical protein